MQHFSVMVNGTIAIFYFFEIGTIQNNVNKTNLEAAIAAAPNAETDQTYYHTNDRYNGTDTSVNGFWADMEAVVNAAKAVPGRSARNAGQS